MDFFVSCNKRHVDLQTPMLLHDYEVAVLDCYVPQEVMRYSHNNDIKVLVFDDHGALAETESFINTIDLDSAFRTVRSLDTALQGYAEVSIDKNGILQCKCKNNIKVVFTSGLSRVLGLKANMYSGSFIDSYPITPRLLLERIIITSKLPLMATADTGGLRSVYHGPIQHHASNAQYHRLADCEISNLKIGFCDILGMELNVPDETFSVLVHFRKSSS